MADQGRLTRILLVGIFVLLAAIAARLYIDHPLLSPLSDSERSIVEIFERVSHQSYGCTPSPERTISGSLQDVDLGRFRQHRHERTRCAGSRHHRYLVCFQRTP